MNTSELSVIQEGYGHQCMAGHERIHEHALVIVSQAIPFPHLQVFIRP